MKTKHTPGPWQIAEYQTFHAVKRGHITIASQCAEANAKFIVRACNSHEGLTDTLKDALKYIKKYKLAGTHFKAMAGAFQDALKQAEGK